MLVMPILHKGKIYNVEVKLKNVYTIQDLGAFQKLFESDIIVNGRSFNQSKCYEKDSPLMNVVYFIRDNALYGNNSFFLTSRRNNQGDMNSFHVALPLPHVTDGLDALYGSVIQNMKREIPGHKKDRNLSLKKLGVSAHITEEKLNLLKKEVRNKEDREENSTISDHIDIDLLSQTLEFVRQFECKVIEEATVDERIIQSLLSPLGSIHTKESKQLKDYYLMAQENSEEYGKLDDLSKIMTGESLRLIRREKNMTKIKSWDHYDRKVE